MAAEVKGAAVTDYVRGINLICTDTEYYIYNAHGDVVSLTSTSGVVTKTYDYDAFGNEANPSDADTNPFRYCGEYFDTETGTYYLRARYYDPSLGRFGTEDPARSGLNWYTYCSNNPVMRIDSTGLKDYIYTSMENYYIENDWGIWDFLNKDRYFAEIDGMRYEVNSIETVKLYEWNSFDVDFLNITFDELINEANLTETTIQRIFAESIEGDLDFKQYLEEETLYLADGILYNKNEIGNFVWAYFLESKGYTGYFSGALAQGGSLVLPIYKNIKNFFDSKNDTTNEKPRLDEEWDKKARWAGVKYYYTRENKKIDYFLKYFGRIHP